jgi:hypothetical protein
VATTSSPENLTDGDPASRRRRNERHEHPVQAGSAERDRAGDPPRSEGDRQTRRPHRHGSDVGPQRHPALAAIDSPLVSFHVVGDALLLTFADGTTHPIPVDAGLGAATVDQIITGGGEYASGWIQTSDARWLNLGTIVSIDLRHDFDPENAFAWA